jgi:hypothetical protein
VRRGGSPLTVTPISHLPVALSLGYYILYKIITLRAVKACTGSRGLAALVLELITEEMCVVISFSGHSA